MDIDKYNNISLGDDAYTNVYILLRCVFYYYFKNVTTWQMLDITKTLSPSQNRTTIFVIFTTRSLMSCT